MRTVSRSTWIYHLISIRIYCKHCFVKCIDCFFNNSIYSRLQPETTLDWETRCCRRRAIPEFDRAQGEFKMGFWGLESSEKKFQFDGKCPESTPRFFLYRVACVNDVMSQSRAAKRTTLTWTNFSSRGSTRTDAPLSATLQFSTPLVNSISSWLEQQADLTRKLKKMKTPLPPFGWDT
jgi:hypothetical protein